MPFNNRIDQIVRLNAVPEWQKPGRVITYNIMTAPSFEMAAPSYYAGFTHGDFSGGTPSSGYIPISPEIAGLIKNALTAISTICNISFQEKPSDPNSVDIGHL